MTQEERLLLLQDLCARLPHKQKVCYKIHDNSEEITETLSGCLLDYFKTGEIAVVKPYLRPMWSMTEEENARRCAFLDDIEGGIEEAISNYIDWLNENKFDYRGLIPMGLALPAKDGMYNMSQPN